MSIEQKFNEARQAVLSGRQLSLEEQAELVQALRGGRFTAAESGGSARTKKTAERTKKSGLSDEDLDAQLGDLGL